MGKNLLELTAEYLAVKDSEVWGKALPGEPTRTLDEISAEYEETLRSLLA